MIVHDGPTTYRKIACPPITENGRWSLSIEGTGERMECADLAVLMREQVKALRAGYDTKLVFLLW